jgi:3'(2'), 5'-bisphosphate nucleotidase
MTSVHSLSISHATLADALLPAVFEAARIQMRYFRGGAKVVTKADTTPVTVADQESEVVLLAALRRLAPGIPVVAEEATAAGQVPKLNGSNDELFLVDPLDGTREFIADRPEFTINVALVKGGVPRFGLIYAPAQSLMFVTLGEHQAIELEVAPDSSATRFSGLPMRQVRTRDAPTDGLVAVASRSHGTPGTDAFLGQYRVARRTAAGSSLKFCVIAKGEADIYPRVGPTSEWDTAAGHAIVSVAGGSVTTLDGGPLVYGKSRERFRNPDFVAWGRGPLDASY